MSMAGGGKTPVYETIIYAPGLQGGTDLETGPTKTVDWTTLAASVADAAKHYSVSLTLPMTCTVNGVSKVLGTTETRLAIMRIGTRLEQIIDSVNAPCAHVYTQVSVDDATGLVAANILYSADNTTAGTKTAVADCLVGTKETIFNLLKDGGAHTFYIFVWVDAGNAVISSMKVWEGVGATASSTYRDCLNLTFTGIAVFSIYIAVVGTGSGVLVETGIQTADVIHQRILTTTSINNTNNMNIINATVLMKESATTDLGYLMGISFNLRSDI